MVLLIFETATACRRQETRESVHRKRGFASFLLEFSIEKINTIRGLLEDNNTTNHSRHKDSISVRRKFKYDFSPGST